MSEEVQLKEIPLDEVAKHTTADSCWMVIGNATNGGPKVYDVTNYLDDHPGGAEVMLDVAGQDADEFFEDIGHSKEARAELKKHLIGKLFLDEKTLAKMKADAEARAQKGGNSTAIVVVVALVAVAIAYVKISS